MYAQYIHVFTNIYDFMELLYINTFVYYNNVLVHFMNHFHEVNPSVSGGGGRAFKTPA